MIRNAVTFNAEYGRTQKEVACLLQGSIIYLLVHCKVVLSTCLSIAR